MDALIENSGKLKIIDALDPTKNKIDNDDIAKFVSDFDYTFMDKSRPNRPDYIIIDNFLDQFPNLEKSDLINARTAAE